METNNMQQLAALIGAGMTYRGDMANEPGVGAVVDVRPCSFYVARIECILHDGRKFTLSPLDFPELAAIKPQNVTRFGASRFALTGDIWHADTIADLHAAAAVRKAREAAEKTAADNAHAAELAKLAAEFPQLERGKAAPNVRRLLKLNFPRVKFSVRSDHSSIRIGWTDGPTAGDVEAIADRFQRGNFDGMTDCYNYTRSAFVELFGGVEYVFTNRDFSDTLILRAIDAVAAEYGAENMPTLEDYRNGRAYNVSPLRTFDGCHSWQSLIYQSANKISVAA